MKKRNAYYFLIDKKVKIFSEKVYEAVMVANIADKVGIKAPSLYKHSAFSDIFNSTKTSQ